MNKEFKAVLSDVRQCFTTISERRHLHGRRPKFALNISVAATLLAFSCVDEGVGFAAYVEVGSVGDKTSWETSEYQRDWGLTAMNTSTAYSLGFMGQNVTVAVMDSGALLSHPELSTDRIKANHVTGHYSTSGYRVPQFLSDDYDGLPFVAGEKFDVTGNWMPGINDGHGTHVTGTIGANRDGSEFHGVAFDVDIIIGNTGGTDDLNCGPFQDYQYFYIGWKALADDLIKANGKLRGGVINNSWGSESPAYELGEWKGDYWVHKEFIKAGELEEALKKVEESGGILEISGESYINNTDSQSEYEYFYHNKISEQKGTKSYIDAAWDAVKGTNVIQVFPTGNKDSGNPIYSSLYPYFHPEAESNWIAVAGLAPTAFQPVLDANGRPVIIYPFGPDYPIEQEQAVTGSYKVFTELCEAGLAKWWTVTAPAESIYSIWTFSDGSTNLIELSGTSMAAPHVTGAMAVLMSRYASMTAPQVREVMFTTASHRNADGSIMEGWENVELDENGKILKTWTVPEGEVSNRMGWGVPDLDKGMYGPGQLLGKFDYNLSLTPLDVWTNDISEVALKQREREDRSWMEATQNGTDLSAEYNLGENFIPLDGTDSDTDHVVSREDAQKWRAAYYERRAKAIQYKIDNGLYNGSLVKRGAGTLVMTGNNSYTGGTTVQEGSLFGFTESFGSGFVNVNGGTFGVLASYNDTFTQKGVLNSLMGTARAEVQKANIIVNDGGTYAVIADQNVQVGTLKFNEGSQIGVTSLTQDAFEQAYNGNAQTGTVTADSIEGFDNAVVTPDYALVNHTVTLDGNTITGVLEKGNKTLADYAVNGNGVSVANALNADETLLAGLTSATKEEARQTIASLANDIHVTANAMSIANGQALIRAVKDQAIGIDGAARVADVDEGRARLWMSAVGNWSKMDRAGSSKLKSDFYTGLVGLEADINVDNKVGIFFGAGKTKFKAGSDGKIDSDDLHFGIYGQSKFEPVRVNYGFAYTHQDRDSGRALIYKDQLFGSSVNYSAKVAQIFGEVAYTGLNFGNVNVEPYVGLAWMHLSADGFSENYAGGNVKTNFESQNLAVSNLGARVKVPFEVGTAKVKAVADVNWTQFMGDTRGKSTLTLGNGAKAKIQSEKLSAVAAVGLGLEAQLGKRASLGVSYYGAYGSKIKSNGVGARFKLAF